MLSGFTSYRVGKDSMRVYYHAHNGSVLYVTPPIAPRTKTPQPLPAPPGALCGNSSDPGPGCAPPPKA